ncbi:MAG: zinc carboxypeptidase [Verrucomicrobia bacterium]|nr:zinc carboxypeptidase [Verrucomicrobiota bacterium]
MNSTASIHFVFALLLLATAARLTGAELRVSTDFEGGAARVESVDQAARVIRFMPGGDPQRGWPCWWYLRVDGVAKDERVTLDLAGSDRPTRNNGQDTGKPLAASWAMPGRATFSTEGKTWQHTAPGKKEGARILYEVTGTGGPLWVAWGPPFTPRDTDALLAEAEKLSPAAKSFELAQTLGGRPVRGLRVSAANAPKPPGIWVHARQHAWESGSCWVARGFTEWLVSDDADAKWLRANAEVFIVPIMDVDNAATGNGGKEAAPRDHNRDWDDKPVYPEVAAAQLQLRALARENRLDVFLDLHNPGPGDLKPFFFTGPPELLAEAGRVNRTNFLATAQARITGPLALDPKPRVTGPAYHPLWKQISGQWVNANGNPHTVSICLETSWNTPHSTTDGYRAVGRQLGQAVAGFQRGKSTPR